MNRRGFTLIELMIATAIIAILASIAIPKFARLLRKSDEGATKGNLGSMRSALSIYYADNTFFPADNVYHDSNSILVSSALAPKYIGAIPLAKATPYHTTSSTVFSHWTDSNGNISLVHDGTTGWMYASGADSSGNVLTPSGQIILDCSHTDTKGTAWSAY